jgi:hypothetical protein
MYGHRVKKQCKEEYGSTTMVGKNRKGEKEKHDNN